MTDMPTPPDAVAAAEAMTEALGELSVKLADTRAYTRRSRHLIKLLAVSVVFDVALSLGLGFVGVRSFEASHSARRAAQTAAVAAQTAAVAADAARVNAENQRVTCVAGNAIRADQVALWAHILTALGDRLPERADIESFVARTFAPRICPP